MTALSTQLKSKPQNRSAQVLNAKRQLMDLLVIKFSDYLRESDSDLAGEIVSGVGRQFALIVD